MVSKNDLHGAEGNRIGGRMSFRRVETGQDGYGSSRIRSGTSELPDQVQKLPVRDRLRICRSSLLRVSSRFFNQQPVVVVSRLIGLKVKSGPRRTPQTQSSGQAAPLLLAPFLSASSLASLVFIPWFTLLAALRACSTWLAPTGGLPQLVVAGGRPQSTGGLGKARTCSHLLCHTCD